MESFPWNVGAIGVVQAAMADIDYTVAPANGSGTVDVVTLPAGCLVTKTIVEVLEAFNAGGTNVLTVGTNDTVDNLAADGDVNEGAVGFNEVSKKVRTTAVTTVKAKYAQTNGAGSAATSGKARVTVEFVRLTAE